ncbi:MAG: CoA pyrophosphatase [Paracoccaceae bacterium]
MIDCAIEAIARVGQASSDFDLNPDFKLPQAQKLRPAGVLICLAEENDEWTMYLTKRSSALKHHPGQIAFPGGKQEASDVDIVATALREAHEEIGLPPENLRVLGTLPPHVTVTSFTMTPVIALLETKFNITPDTGEVQEVFTVPLSHVLNPENYSVQSRRWRGRTRSYYCVPYGPYYIWGATARILRGWAEAAHTI